ncbi:MAG: type IV pilus modification protein PilV [Polaromonas sp.]
MQPFHQLAHTRKLHGFAMIEILVSLVIFAIGMLGAAGLQLATLRSNQFTAQATTATQLARDYEEIVQMVPSANISSSEGTSSLSVLDTSVSDTSTITQCKGSSAACTPAQMTAFMLNDWKTRVTAELPAGRAVVCRDSAPKDTTGTGLGLYHWTCNNQGDMIMIKLGWAAKSSKTDKVMQAIADDNRPRIVVTVFGNQKDFVVAP